MTQGSERLLFIVGANANRGQNSRRQTTKGESDRLPAYGAASYESSEVEKDGWLHIGTPVEAIMRRVRQTTEAQASAIQSDKKGSRRHIVGGPPSPTTNALKGGLGTPERKTKCM